MCLCFSLHRAEEYIFFISMHLRKYGDSLESKEHSMYAQYYKVVPFRSPTYNFANFLP